MILEVGVGSWSDALIGDSFWKSVPQSQNIACKGQGRKQTSNSFPSLPFPSLSCCWTTAWKTSFLYATPPQCLSPILWLILHPSSKAGLIRLMNLTDSPPDECRTISCLFNKRISSSRWGLRMSPMKYGLKSPIPDLKFQAIIQPWFWSCDSLMTAAPSVSSAWLGIRSEGFSFTRLMPPPWYFFWGVSVKLSLQGPLSILHSRATGLSALRGWVGL